MAFHDVASTIHLPLVTEHCASARRSLSTLAGVKGTVEGDAALSFLRRFCEEDAPIAEVAAVGAAIAARARARGRGCNPSPYQLDLGTCCGVIRVQSG
jgi:hypothetical protein